MTVQLLLIIDEWFQWLQWFRASLASTHLSHLHLWSRPLSHLSLRLWPPDSKGMQDDGLSETYLWSFFVFHRSPSRSFKAKIEKSDLLTGSSPRDSGCIRHETCKHGNWSTPKHSLHLSAKRPHVVPFCVKLQTLQITVAGCIVIQYHFGGWTQDVKGLQHPRAPGLSLCGKGIEVFPFRSFHLHFVLHLIAITRAF